MNHQNFKYLSPSKFDRHYIFKNFENPRIIFILFYGVHKENMFTTNLEDGREAPSKASKIKRISKISYLLHKMQIFASNLYIYLNLIFMVDACM